jgi:hypothetical protein
MRFLVNNLQQIVNNARAQWMLRSDDLAFSALVIIYKTDGKK